MLTSINNEYSNLTSGYNYHKQTSHFMEGTVHLELLEPLATADGERNKKLVEAGGLWGIYRTGLRKI